MEGLLLLLASLILDGFTGPTQVSLVAGGFGMLNYVTLLPCSYAQDKIRDSMSTRSSAGHADLRTPFVMMFFTNFFAVVYLLIQACFTDMFAGAVGS